MFLSLFILFSQPIIPVEADDVDDAVTCTTDTDCAEKFGEEY